MLLADASVLDSMGHEPFEGSDVDHDDLIGVDVLAVQERPLAGGNGNVICRRRVAMSGLIGAQVHVGAIEIGIGGQGHHGFAGRARWSRPGPSARRRKGNSRRASEASWSTSAARQGHGPGYRVPVGRSVYGATRGGAP